MAPSPQDRNWWASPANLAGIARGSARHSPWPAAQPCRREVQIPAHARPTAHGARKAEQSRAEASGCAALMLSPLPALLLFGALHCSWSRVETEARAASLEPRCGSKRSRCVGLRPRAPRCERDSRSQRAACGCASGQIGFIQSRCRTLSREHQGTDRCHGTRIKFSRLEAIRF